MSYDIRLTDTNGDTVVLRKAHNIVGGIYALGGTREAWLNVTYNYSGHFNRVLDGGIRSLYGKTAADSILILESAAEKLGQDEVEDYWQPTEGNARRALLDLATLARLAPPESKWDGD
jgi:hypothetical protein